MHYSNRQAKRQLKAESGLTEKQTLLEGLKGSARNLGHLYPVLIDANGKIIDGEHRLEVDHQWPRRHLKDVRTDKQRILVKLISNTCRRKVTAKEKTGLLEKLGRILHEEGTPYGEISKKIVEETGMSYTWVMKYLPDTLKDSAQSNRRKGSSVTRHVSGKTWLSRLTKPPKKRLIEISRYGNMSHSIYAFDNVLHKRIEAAASFLNTTPQTLVQNIICRGLREISIRFR